MSMNTAISGLNAAQADIAATSHNIANVATVGFRGSRTEFADLFNQSPYSVSRTTVGSGVQVTRVAQDFSQGSIQYTGNRLDLAIEGAGFFALRQTTIGNDETPETLYSRAGAFGLSANGTIVNASNQQLLGWPVAANGQALSESIGAAQPMNVPLAVGQTQATSTVRVAMDLPSDPAMAGQQAAIPPTAAFDPADRTTWAHRSSIPVFDTSGRSIEAEVYLIRTANPSATSPDTTYQVNVLRNGQVLTAQAGNDLTLDGNGALSGQSSFQFDGADGPITLDLTDSRLQNAPFIVQAASQDGRTTQQLTNLEIDAIGTLWATYGAEERRSVGKLLLVNFPNPGGLKVMGAAAFTATADSGEPLAGSPGGMGLGLLRSGALEKANVDLTEELVNLITAQRNYQASAKAMETSSQMMQTIMNLRN
jgi:flagellar hook protein FlgE